MYEISRGTRCLFARLTLTNEINRCLSLSENISSKKHEDGNMGPQYCLKLVQQNDYENFLCTLLLNEDQRRDAFALRAFNVEVAKCNNNVSEDHIAKMRLKFWSDSVDKCFSKTKSYVTDHPVLQELKNTIDKNKLTKTYLKRLVNARDRPLNQQFSTLKEMEEYSEQAFSSLYYLMAECKNIKDLQVDHAISHVGKAQGITSLLRAIPYKGRNQAVNIPQDIMIKNGVSQERILRYKYEDKGVEDCVFEVATAAHQHLEQARRLKNSVPTSARQMFLPAVAVERYLERLRKANFRLTHQSCLQRDSLLPMSLYWHGWRGNF